MEPSQGTAMGTWAGNGEKLLSRRTSAPAEIHTEAPRSGSAEAGLFAGLGADALRALQISSARQRVRKGKVLFSEGERLAQLFVIEGGSFKLVLHSEEGKELIVALAGTGDSFGAFAEPSDSAVLARALEDAVVLAVPLAAVRQAMSANVELAVRLMSRAEAMLRAAEVQASRLAFESVPRRLAGLLLEASDGGSGTLRFPLNQTEIANLIGSSRETVCSLLNQFRRDGLIESSRGKIQVLDRRRLESAGDRRD